MPTLSIRDATVAYTDVGQGPPVLAVHGSAASRRFWRGLADRLAPRYRVIAPDLIGYGESSAWRAGARATERRRNLARRGGATPGERAKRGTS